MIVTLHSNEIDAALDAAAAHVDQPRTLSIAFDLHESWATPPRYMRLTAVYLIERDTIQTFVTDRPLDTPTPAHFFATANRCRAAIFALDQPFRLAPIAVAKPWGREICYTRIDARGISGVTDARHTTPLPWVLASAPRRLCAGQPIARLNMLEPSPEPVLGDLYFELHESKQKLYVVIQVDRRAWPDGRGAIRFGMNAARRASYRDDNRFRADYLAAVRAYECVRRTIDGLLDKKRMAAGIDLHAAVPIALVQRWLRELDSQLLDDERARRAAMDAFTQVRAVSEGDIVLLPCRLPHALQHGVRVIEVQTPTFDRRIIAFAQKVLTQDHWDTEAAIECMQLDNPPPSTVPALIDQPDCTVERIVAFDRCAARRVRLAPAARVSLPAELPYALCVGISGEVALGGATLTREVACLVPRAATQRTLINHGSQDAVCLLAGPEL